MMTTKSNMEMCATELARYLEHVIEKHLASDEAVYFGFKAQAEGDVVLESGMRFRMTLSFEILPDEKDEPT